MPSVNRLSGELRDRGLEVVVVSFREDLDQVRRIVDERGYAVRALHDASGEVTGRLYGVWGTPTSYLIDRQGRLVGRAVGPRPWETPAARQLLLDLLAAP